MSGLDYNLLQEALNMGGHVVRVVDLDTGEIRAECAEVSCLQDTAHGGSPLSKVHKGTFVEWHAGASLLKVSRGIECDEPPKGGKRGKITGFSFASRRRMMYTLAKVRRDAIKPDFVTLTYPNIFPSPIESKKHLDNFIRRLRRAFPSAGFIWKLEPQKRGAPHYHLMVWGCEEKELSDFVPLAWHEIAGGGDQIHLLWHEGKLGNRHCVSRVTSQEHMMRYASKYLGKTFEVAGWDDIYTGRFWAVVQKQNIPFAVSCVYEISKEKAVHIMRYQKRFAGISSRNYPSLTIICDASQWAKNVIGEVLEEK